MGEPSRNLVILAAGAASPARGLAGRLEGLGWAATVVRTSGPPSCAPGVVVCPGLGRPWRRFWAVRALVADGGVARPDAILALGVETAEPALGLAERWGVPYVLAIEEFLPPGGRLRLSRARCRALVATAPELAEDLIESAGVPRRGLTIIRPGIEADLACDDEPPDATPGSGRVPVVGTAGPLASGSGLVAFLEAAARLVGVGLDAEFVVAGRGPNEEPLRRLAGRLGVAERVTFADDAAEHASFWRVLDVFCLPALEPTTGGPLARALAHGVPSVATDAAGLGGLLLDGETGLRVPRGDAQALADAVQSLLADPARARALGRAGRARIARDFDPDREAREFAETLRRATESDSGLVGRPRALRADAGSAAVG
jgi:glycosyltransferase involved in cell wall biosynthesis